MAPMAGPRTTCDYDSIQPCFFLAGEDEDLFPTTHSQLLPGPGEDIWKKFELLPTPPMSPSRMPPQSDPPLSAADHLAAVSELLDEEWQPSAAFLQSFIIQDCMWSSSFTAATKLEQVVSERLASLQARQNLSGTGSLTAGGSDPQAETGYLQDLQATASACIDPSEVFPFTPTDQNQNQSNGAVGSELSLETPPLSSSSESEEEEEDGEEEEIDVVTVDRQRTSQRSPLVLKRSHINIEQHNYAALQPAVKRPKRVEPPAAAVKQRGGRRCWSPRSDSEDEDRRRTHNVLERQRRNELRISFLALREQIPELAANHKAAKVVILKRAAGFVREVEADERRLLKKKDELTKRSKELRLRLEQIRTLH